MKKADIEFSNKLKGRFKAKQDQLPKQAGIMGGSDGALRVPNLDGYIYVTIGDKTVPVYNSLVTPAVGKKVWVGYTSVESKLYQVLSTRSEKPTGEQVGIGGGYAPSKYYEWLAKNGGQDPLHVHLRAISYLKIGVSATGGLNIQLYKGYVNAGGTFLHVDTQDLDLTTHVPATAGNAALVLITIDDTGAVVQTKGTEFAIADIAYSDLPAVPADTVFVCGAARVYNGQTVFQERKTNTDFIDLRFTGLNWGKAIAHNDLSGLQGGTSGEYYHLTAAQLAVLSVPITAANGGTGVANGASATLTLPNMAITLGGGGASQTYTLPAVGGTFALGAETLNVATTNDVTGATHTHAITASSDPAAASSLLKTDSAGFLRLHLFRVGSVGTGTPSSTYPFILLQSQNAAAGFSVRNGWTGTGARAEFVVLNDNNLGAKFLVFSSAYTTSGLFVAGRTLFDASDTGGLAVGASHASGVIALYSGGLSASNVGLLMDTTQNVGIGRLIGETINAKLEVLKKTTTTNAIIETTILQAEVSTSSTGGAAGFGVGLSLRAETATNAVYTTQGRIWSKWIVATNGSETAAVGLDAYTNSTAQEFISGEGNSGGVKLALYGGTRVARGAALTTQLTTITHTAPGTPDYAIQDLIDSSAGAAFGFATKDEGNSLLAAVANLQVIVAEINARLNSTTGINAWA